jgi:hypothetical protein
VEEDFGYEQRDRWLVLYLRKMLDLAFSMLWFGETVSHNCTIAKFN